MDEQPLVERARSLRPFLTAHAPENEKNRRISDAVIEALDAAGIWAATAPRRWGGLGVSMYSMARIGAELAKGCASTAWVYYVLSTGAWIASVAPDAVQEDVFANGLPRVCGGGMGGTAVPVDGGYRVNGRWNYSSGCVNATWGIFFVAIEAFGTTQGDAGRIFVPMRDLTIEETWRSIGMAGTGSHTSVANDLLVPDHRFVPGSLPVAPIDPAQRHFGENSDYLPMVAALRITALGPLVGAAEAVLESVIARAGKRSIVLTSYAVQSSSPVAQHAIGRAAARIGAARHLMEAAARLLDEAAAEHRTPSYDERARLRGEAALVVQLCTETVDSLLSVAGSSAFDDGCDIQRMWRDLSTGARHASLIPDIGYEVSGRALLGVDPNIVPLDFV